MKSLLSLTLSCSFLACVPTLVSAQTQWMTHGPDGGDARAFASDPSDHNHIFLGSLIGVIYDTHDGGKTWAQLARLGNRDDLALDNIVVDPTNPKHILVGAWVLDHADGGLYESQDGGKTWVVNPQMNGHSIRALTLAPSDPKILVIGALDGVFRSVDMGKSWTLISPTGSNEIHEVESIAIDPKNPRTIYAGTWHLPWKTTDGGEHWNNITKENGLIDDSDVFSIIIDPKNPQNVYLSACSGIYRSVNEAAKFEKVKGIPSDSRRTRVLMEDPQQENTVYAGTTNGLWKTTDAGHTFTLHGNPNYIINDVNVDPQNTQHVLLATDRTGVLMSEDGGLTFQSANNGFSARQISAVAQNPQDSSKLFVGVLNDKAAGGVFSTEDGGNTWTQMSTGLNGADIFSLGETSTGTLLAGTRHGIYRLDSGTWKVSGLTLALPPEAKAEETAKAVPVKTRTARGRADSNPAPKGGTARRTSSAAPVKVGHKRSPSVLPASLRSTPPQESSTGVYALASSNTSMFAATEEGLLSSTDDGHTWNRVRTANGTPWRLLSAQGQRVVVADLKQLSLSTDQGVTFHSVVVPAELTRITSTVLDGTGRIWLGGREGVFLSEDDGATWHSQKGLYVPNVSGLFYDKTGDRVLVTSYQPSTLVFAVHIPDLAVRYWNSGWILREARPVGDHLIGFTPYNGVVLEPRMVASESQQVKK